MVRFETVLVGIQAGTQQQLHTLIHMDITRQRFLYSRFWV